RRLLALAGGGAVAGAVVGAAGGFWATRLGGPRGARPRFNIAIPPGSPLMDVFMGPSAVALSPDGRTLAFCANEPISTLWVRSLESTKARELPGTSGANSPFFSPDGKW